jgi:fumarylacetoacetase
MVRSCSKKVISHSNIPFGVFLLKENVVTVGTRMGDSAIDLGALQQLNYFEGIELTDDMFMQDTLNDLSLTEKNVEMVRNRIAEIFDENNAKLRDNAKDRDIVILKWKRKCNLPVLIGDYTDFYSSKETCY